MALTLLTAITATDTVFDVLGSDDLETGDFKTIDSETIVIRRAQVSTLAYGQSARQRVSVYRGSGGTRAAAHAASASLATYSGGGSGGVTVDNGSDPPAAVTTLLVPGADVSVAGTASLLYYRRLGPYPIAWDTPGFVNPDNNGLGIGPVLPVGTWVEVRCFVKEQWDSGNDDSIDVYLGDPDGDVNNAPIARYEPRNQDGYPDDIALRESPVLRQGVSVPSTPNSSKYSLFDSSGTHPAILTAEAQVVLQFYPNSAPGTGTADFYIVTATAS